MATITSKRQLTIPAQLFRQLELSAGDKVLVSVQGNALKVEPAVNKIERLAGSVSVPPDKKGVDLDQEITRAKQQEFKDKQ